MPTAWPRICAPIAVLVAVWTSGALDAAACSPPQYGWWVAHQEETVTTTVDGPLVVPLSGWDSSGDESPGPDAGAFAVTLSTSTGEAVPTTIEARLGGTSREGFLIITHSEPLTFDVDYTLTIVESPDQFPSEMSYPVVLVESLPEPVPTLTLVEATEHERGATEACCDAASTEDSTCFEDSCGGFPHGEQCRICWNASYTYMVMLNVDWALPTGHAPGRYSQRLLRVDASGEELEVVAYASLGHGGTAMWPQDTAGPYCLRVEVDDVASGVTSTSETLCVEEADVTRIERRDPDVAEFVDRCDAGTIEEPDPVNNIGGPNPPGPEPVGAGDGSGKGEPGGCSSLAPIGGTGWPSFALVALVLWRRRRPT